MLTIITFHTVSVTSRDAVATKFLAGQDHNVWLELQQAVLELGIGDEVTSNPHHC